MKQIPQCAHLFYKNSPQVTLVNRYLIPLFTITIRIKPLLTFPQILYHLFLYTNTTKLMDTTWPTIFARPNITHFEEENSRPDF